MVKRSLVFLAPLIALFVGAMLGARRTCGPSPIAWFDTFNDQQEVTACLSDDSCTLLGMGTSIGDKLHAVGWLEFRTLIARLGLDLDDAHRILQLFDAVAVVLVFYVATQLGGPLTGVLATWMMAHNLGMFGIRYTAVYNTRPLLFLGAVLAVACTAVVLRPGRPSVALAALTAAVMANVHLACIVAGASVIWVALLARGRRIELSLWGAAVFCAATFVIAPASWVHDLASLLGPRPAGAPGGGVTPGAGPWGLEWELFAIIAYGLSLLFRRGGWAEYRRRAHGAIAVLVPFVTAFVVAPYFGLQPNPKYLAHLQSASAIAGALPIGMVLERVCRALSPLALNVAERTLPFAMALLLAVPSATADNERTPTMADIAAVARILHDEHGWDVARIAERLKTPESMVVLRGLVQLDTDAKAPVGARADIATSAVLMVVDEIELPRPLPTNWRIVRRAGGASWVLITLRSRIDWSAFEACVQSADDEDPTCEESSLQPPTAGASFMLPGMPRADKRPRAALRLRLRLRAAPVGSTEVLFMPHLPNLCEGEITNISDGTGQIDADRRRATLLTSVADETPLLEIQWNVLSPQCDGTAYDGMPPFFLEGTADEIGVLEQILRRREARG